MEPGKKPRIGRIRAKRPKNSFARVPEPLGETTRSQLEHHWSRTDRWGSVYVAGDDGFFCGCAGDSPKSCCIFFASSRHIAFC